MCLSPVTVRVPDGNSYRSISVPCGHCLDCLRIRQNEHTCKICYELADCHCKASWITLTYRESSVPFIVNEDTGETLRVLRRKDIVDWIKRLRYRLEKNGNKVRLSYCGEYGSNTFRPHFHCLIYGYLPEDLRECCADWRKRFGRVNIKPVDFSKSVVGVGRYLAKYASKGVFSESMPIFHNPSFPDVPKPFFRDSNYLGVSAFLRQLPYWLQLDSPRHYDSLTDCYDHLKDFWRASFGNFSFRLPVFWRHILQARKGFVVRSSKSAYVNKFLPYVQKIKDFYLSSLGSFPRLDDVKTAMDSLSDRFLLRQCGVKDISVGFTDEVVALLSSVLDKAQSDLVAFANRFKTKSQDFYKLSFC